MLVFANFFCEKKLGRKSQEMGRNSVKEVDRKETFIGEGRHGRSFRELKRL